MRFLVLAFSLLFASAALADFTATYERLPDSPSSVSRSWYGGDVLNDGRFLYGLGHSHNSNGDNSIWAFNPATNSHSQLFANTGNKWVYDSAVAGSGHWSDPSIVALSNRNNHVQFYLPGRNEWWAFNGTFWYQQGTLLGGRFDIATKKWVNVSKTWTEFNADIVAGGAPNIGPNASVAVCRDINTVVFFGGMAVTNNVVLLEPNAGAEPYKWTTLPRPPIFQPSENARESAACVGDTVYFVTAQQRISGPCCQTPDPAPVWKFHVPSQTWTRLADGPPGGYFPTLTYDSDAQALLYYGGGTGGGSAAMWAYDLVYGAWQDLTGTTSAPRVDMMTAGFVPGYGHVLQGGKVHDATGATISGASKRTHKITLARIGEVPPPPEPDPEPPPEPEPPPPEPDPNPMPDPLPSCPVGCIPDPNYTEPVVDSGPVVEPDPVVIEPSPDLPSGTAFSWAKIPLPGHPNSPGGSMKHQRLVEGPGGRVWILGGDWSGPPANTGHQEVYSFDPLSATGDWRLEAPYCGTVQSPTHWHTDEAGVAWDEKRGVFWKLAGTPYGKEDSCPPGTTVKAKVITFDPVTGKWAVPIGVDQKNIGYVANGVFDPVADQMVQIVDKFAFHLDLITGQWRSYPLPGDVMRFNAIAARLDRDVWWLNRNEVLESYSLDTHASRNYGLWPWPKMSGWETAMTFAYGQKVMVVWPRHLSTETKHAALFDPATKQWTVLDQGEGRGNTGMMHSSGKLILMGGMAPPEDQNEFVWVGALG